MSDISVAEIPVDQEERPLPLAGSAPARNALLDGPILRTLLWLAWPNVVALSAGTCVVIAETSYIGRLGMESLAAMALVFPFVILTMTMSGGAMGGGVSSAIARALGAGDTRARLDAGGACAADRRLLRADLHAGDADLRTRAAANCSAAAATCWRRRSATSQIFFGGAVMPWLMNTLAGILRGTGNMKLPSLMVLSSAVCQIILGGTLGLGLGPVPQFGMRGVAAGSLIAYSIGGRSWRGICFPAARASLRVRGLRIQRGMFFDILKVGAVACFSPLQSVLTISIFTHMLARFGTEMLAGYGIGARLEFMLTSMAFAVGIASVPMIGMAIGAGSVARARRIAWIAGCVSFVVGRPDRDRDRDLSRSLGQHLHRRSRRARRQPAISGDRGADVRLHRAVDLDVFFLAGRGEGAGSGAGANRAAVVRRRRRLVAVDA